MEVLRLPRGRTLSSDAWAARHRAITLIAWLHVPALLAFALLTGKSLGHSLLDVVPVASFAAAAGVSGLGRRWRSGMSCLALLTCSAVLVHLWQGHIEAHFHFFVAVTLLAIYEDWPSYGLAFGYVLLHHALMGMMAPGSVYDHADAVAHPLRWAAYHAAFISALGIINVISWRMQEDARTETRDSEERFRSAFDDAPIGMAIVGLDGVVERVNARLLTITGHAADALVGAPLQSLVPPEDRRGGTWPSEEAAPEAERRLLHADGSVGWALWQHSLVPDRAGAPIHWVSHCLDISTRKRAESDLDHQAHHDALTGLPNRTLFLSRLRTWLADGRPLSVVFIDLDNFKLVNDSLGHGAGDTLLVTVAERLREALRPGDEIARFGGDEFAIGLPDAGDPESARRVADRLAVALRQPLMLEGRQRFVSASFGLRCAEPGLSPEELLRDADAAMYQAKELGKARCEVYDGTLRERAVERLDLEGALRGALSRGELRVLYQPQVALDTGTIIGAEALVRWERPDHGTISPVAFIPLAEQNGLIIPIGAWVLNEAVHQAATWAASGHPICVSVNVSPRQLAHAGLVAEVEAALTSSGLDPQLLELEITESAVMADPEAADAALARLKRLGVRVAIDDFGVGFASLSQLKSLLPLHTLKIDKSFVDGVTAGGEDRAIVDAVLQLAGSLGLTAIAEGVEGADQARALLGMGCTVAQGYHFARPQPASAVDALLAAAPVVA